MGSLGPAIHVDVFDCYLSAVADCVHPFMEIMFPDGCVLFHQDNMPCCCAKMNQEWFEEHKDMFDVDLVSAIPPVQLRMYRM